MLYKVGPLTAAHGPTIKLLYTKYCMTADEIAPRFPGNSPDTIRRTLVKMGVRLRPHTTARSSSAKFCGVYRAGVIHLYQDEEWTLKDIAARYHVSPSSIKRFLVSWGVPLRHYPSHRPVYYKVKALLDAGKSPKVAEQELGLNHRQMVRYSRLIRQAEATARLEPESEPLAA